MVVDFRFPRPHRLLTPEAFTRVFREGFRSSDPLFTLLAAPNGLPAPRLGLAVSRKVSPRAVGRNRIKRQARESFRHVCKDIPAIDIVVMAKKEAAAATNAELRNSLDRHWQRLASKCVTS
ncbi:MAG: ribonuclease P protein component [Proteobacteria bacterium]|nr:ribonuclease P protein component [Pseudomonadota bacterium]